MSDLLAPMVEHLRRLADAGGAVVGPGARPGSPADVQSRSLQLASMGRSFLHMRRRASVAHPQPRSGSCSGARSDHGGFVGPVLVYEPDPTCAGKHVDGLLLDRSWCRRAGATSSVGQLRSCRQRRAHSYAGPRGSDNCRTLGVPATDVLASRELPVQPWRGQRSAASGQRSRSGTTRRVPGPPAAP